VQHSSDEQTALIRSDGITAYACFPLISREQLIGTLAFGSRRRTHFDAEAVKLLQTICDLMATAVDRWRTHQALQVYTGQLERSNRDLQEFAFAASHDLKEPLRKIEIFSRMILQESSDCNERQRGYLERISQSAKRLTSMVDGLLQLARLESRTQPYREINLTQVVHLVVSELEIQLRRARAEVSVGELPTLDADELQMHRLFQNLISNAVKFQPPGNLPRVEIYARPAQTGWVEICVQDNGIGIPDGVSERIFQVFQRATGRSDYDGIGMGLAICRKIVERHGGSIAIESREGQGSIFVVKLPLAQRALKENESR
jgi:signal transduction histidine kinase